MAAVQAEDVRASFLFVGDLNLHHQAWLGSTIINHHGVAAFDFATVSGCNQLVVDRTHARGGTFDLLMTDVPDLVYVCSTQGVTIIGYEVLYDDLNNEPAVCTYTNLIPSGRYRN